MFRKDVANFLKENKNSVIYIGSSNKNIDIYFENLLDSGIEIIELSNIQDEEEYYKINYQLLETLKTDKKNIILTSLEGLLMDYSLNNDIISLSLGIGITRKELLELLEKNGYKKNYLVEKRMEFSVRGDIVDIFPPSGDNPIRIEYFGDEIDRITYFSVVDQKSFEKISSINIYINKKKENKVNFLEILNKLKEKRKYDIYLENSEIVEYKIEEAIVREREKEDEIRNIYEKIKKIAKKLEVEKTENDIQKVRPLNKKSGVKYENISQIREGDYIIHENYGVGLYLGIQEINGTDHLSIRYADEDRLFVPIENLNKIERFLVSGDKVPEVYNLGRRGFKRKRDKMEKDMLEFAKEIVEIQAKRAMNTGYSFSPDTVWQEEFEEKFPYIETKDQKNAIKDVKRDMESSRVMDRIVCGDVGYGKTEVAIRAAFKCIMNEKQVLLVAPTTVLAQQHYERFVERYKDYPITVKLLSRLQNDSEQKEILKNMKENKVDLIVGTHRALSGDLKFSDLGLIIVDEEQKFGVKHKEKLKKIKNNVDMLTLTATPIPRTLNYALLGIRDISIIETAPEGRVPIETMFIDDNKKDIREAIMKEISREGQVFYIFNRVKRIEDKLSELKKILPKFVNIDYIHGQMAPNVIRNRLKKFQDGDIDILLSTTIIENGIDIENANTILIEGLDKLGLSQVYQLRGRVGRGKRKSYCYLIMDQNRTFGKKVLERNATLKDVGQYGGGFKLSLEDMRIRGAGEILGEKQHGALETFGYNLYTKLLQEEIAKVKNEYKEEFVTKVTLLEKAFIPNDYIENEERLIIYRRVINIKELSDLDEMKIELVDRFGEFPEEVTSLFKYLEIKILGTKLKIKEIVEHKKEIFFKFDNDNLDFEKLMILIQTKKARYSKIDDGLYYSGEILEFLDWYKEK